uniref:non-specific serine/threonine protein kinase n=1 Tax=Bionectria ochroleuca TaxID=29856 RepID=A0A8H7NHF6_BIOOC
MAYQGQSRLIEDHPIGSNLDVFRDSFTSLCKDRTIFHSPDPLAHFTHEDIQNLALDLLSLLRKLPVILLLQSKTGHGPLRNDLLKLISAVASDEFDFDRVKPLLKSALADELDDALIWKHLYDAVTESTPPPRPIPSSIQQTPLSQNTSGLVNSSEFRQDVDPILKLELGPLYAGLPNFHNVFFGDVSDLDRVSKTVFRRCTEGDHPLFTDGWTGWPATAKESDVLAWFGSIIPKLEAFASDRIPTPTTRRKLLSQPRTPLIGSTGKRSMDIGFVNSDITYNPDSEDLRYRWLHILVAGELKSNPKADTASIAWIDLARYVREIFGAQENRRFVLGFTLCGSLMRDGGLRFVMTILGFLRMNGEMLGFDPTIRASGDEKYIDIERNDRIERLIIDEVMRRAHCIAGRATVCWRAHRKEDPQTPLVIKDSWQYPDRDEEGELLRDATEKGVANVARYYHHETVRVQGANDDIQQSIRKGLDVTKAANYRPGRATLQSSANASISRKERSSSAGVKRPSSDTDATLPPIKRSRPTSPAKSSGERPPNRVHRRVILGDYGKPIYKASSRVALLSALEGCVEGHELLYNAGLLHRDISINNLMVNEDDRNPSWRAFLIDLDLAVREQRESASGAKGKTGTRAFMAIGALLGEQHSFMHDLESFFWVIFWICIHYNGPDESRVVQEFDKWNSVKMGELAKLKKGKLRKAVFPNGGRWERGDGALYPRMREILREAQKDPNPTSLLPRTSLTPLGPEPINTIATGLRFIEETETLPFLPPLPNSVTACRRFPSQVTAIIMIPHKAPLKLRDVYFSNGRWYGKNGDIEREKYKFPIDEEEKTRLDMFHKFFLVARNNSLFSAPLDTENPLRVLDIGTGTGIWAIELSEKYPQMHLQGLDINMIQPEMIPRTMEPPKLHDVEGSWDTLSLDWDFIHVRTLFGSIQYWPTLYKKIFMHLKPDTGFVEQVEIDWARNVMTTPSHQTVLYTNGRRGFWGQWTCTVVQ